MTSLITQAHNAVRYAMQLSIVKFARAMYEVLRGRLPDRLQPVNRSNTLQYISWSFAFLLAASLVAPMHSTRTSWASVVASLPDVEVEEHFRAILGFDVDVWRAYAELELTAPGFTPLSAFLIRKIGTLDPIQIGLKISEIDPAFGHLFVTSAEHKMKGRQYSLFSHRIRCSASVSPVRASVPLFCGAKRNASQRDDPAIWIARRLWFHSLRNSFVNRSPF